LKKALGKGWTMKTSTGPVQLDATILTRLREMAKDGKHASELAAFLFDEIGRGNVMLGIAYFVDAFRIGIGKARVLAEWQGTPRGTRTDQQLDDELDPPIELYASKGREGS
jgi:hypothetical protein